MSETRSEAWLSRAILAATVSRDLNLRDRVGCVIVDGFDLISTGWNHTLDDTCMRDAAGKARPFVVHAETAAIQAALVESHKMGGDYLFLDANRFKVYCTKEPCLHCLVQLANAGVKEVHYIDAIPESKSGKNYLKHFPSIKVYQQHADQLPRLLRVLGIYPGGSTEPAPSVATGQGSPAT